MEVQCSLQQEASEGVPASVCCSTPAVYNYIAPLNQYISFYWLQIFIILHNFKDFLTWALHTICPFPPIASGERDEATDHGRVCLQQQVPTGAASRQPAAF